MALVDAKRDIDLGWVDSAPLLDDLQAGSLRRILNLSAQLPEDWSGMMGPTTLQEDFGGLRFQLAYMSYALALTHVHRLPAAPALFQTSFDQLIQKVLSPDVWSYWHYVSTGNGPFNQSLGELPAEWNPVEKDNIMYSSYVQSMALMYHYLFRDAKYAKPGALTFSIDPLFWSLGGKHFAYDERSLNEHLYWMMVERGYLGIACEPNCVFQACTQVPILGFRFHDLIHGTNTASEVTEGYLKAWSEFGVLNAAGHYNMMVQERERAVLNPREAPWVDFWVGALMHAWNPEFVKKHYPGQMKRWIEQGPDETLWVMPDTRLKKDGTRLFSSARDFGWAAVFSSEVGDEATLRGLLAYADRFLRPVRTDRSYYYGRHDEAFDTQGRLAAMDPHTGNALLAYARLNIPDGLRKLYDGPWTDSHFAEPALISMTPDLDIRRAWFDVRHNALALTLASPASPVKARLTIANAAGRGEPVLLRDGAPFQSYMHMEMDRLVIEFDFSAETTLVLSWA